MTKEKAIDLILFEYKRCCNMEKHYNDIGEFYDQFYEEASEGIEGMAMEFYNAVDYFMADKYYDNDFDEAYKTLNMQGTSDMIEFLYEYYDRLF